MHSVFNFHLCVHLTGSLKTLPDSAAQMLKPQLFLTDLSVRVCVARVQVLFACAEALYAHGYSNEACRLAVELARDLLANPPDLKVEQPQTKVNEFTSPSPLQLVLLCPLTSLLSFCCTVSIFQTHQSAS